MYTLGIDTRFFNPVGGQQGLYDNVIPHIPTCALMHRQKQLNLLHFIHVVQLRHVAQLLLQLMHIVSVCMCCCWFAVSLSMTVCIPEWVAPRVQSYVILQPDVV